MRTFCPGFRTDIFLSPIAAAASMLLMGCATSPSPETTPIAEVTADFYSTLEEESVIGLPNGLAWRKLEPLFSKQLVAALRASQAEQNAAMRANPDEKPPYVDGDLFSSLFEGPTGFRVGRVRLQGNQAEVTVHLVHTNGGSTTKWIDHVILQNVDGTWKIDNIRYGGNWAFGSKGTLRDNLASPEDC